MPASSLPAKCRVAIIGGGPAGSSTATLLAREGVDVVLLEKEKFPRYHIGESLLLSARQMFELLGIDDKIAKHGFIKKYGAYFKIKQGLKPGHIDFSKSGRYNYSYQVVRSEFDKILLDHSKDVGAKVFEETRVQGIEFDGDRPIALTWAGNDGAEGRLEFEYLVDASGLSGVMATRYLKDRVYQDNFANVAVGRYFRGYRPFKEQEPGAFFMESLANSSGWTWFIPLHNGTVSVGIVVHRDEFAKMKQEHGGDLEKIFDAGLKLCPDICRLLAEAQVEGEPHVWQDYSYVANTFAGPNYRLAGDAAGFIDPFFSNGVHMALLGALSAAATIASSMKGEVDEARAGIFHDKCVRRAYTRFVLSVSGAYVQIRNQKDVVLHGVTNHDMQLAFDMLQPVVSGAADALKSPVSQSTLEKAVTYIGEAALVLHGEQPSHQVSKLIAKARERGRMQFFTDVTSVGAIDGYYIRTQQGRLGLAKTNAWWSIYNTIRRKIIRTIIPRALPGIEGNGHAPTVTESQAKETVGAT